MSNILDRIKQYADYKSFSIRKIEKDIGASNGVISNAIKKNTDIQSKWVSNIIDVYPEISPLWLLTGKGPMISVLSEHKVTAQVGDNPELFNYLREKDDLITSLSVEVYQLKAQVEKLKKDAPRSPYNMVAEP